VRSPILNRLAFGALIAWSLLPLPASGRKPQANDSDFVSIQSVDRTITIDLRYAGSNNVTRHAIYPPGISAMARASVAQRLAIAQKYLKTKGYGLKIWDAYRPAATQQQLWHATHNRSFVADPTGGIGSMHTRGAAVDATLVDSSGRGVAMPTDFDSFTPAALIAYEGTNPVVRSNLKLLQKAMAHAGFYGLRTEWWHFCAPDWKKYPQVPELNMEPAKKRWFW
jgi:D-alanyl-D-alanine dipeptidase